MDRCVLVVLVSLWIPTGAAAAPQDLSPARFSTLSSLRCTFTTGATGVWDRGAPEVRTRSEVLVRVNIDDIDSQSGTATIRDVPATAASAIVQFSGWTLHILQTEAAGGLNVTSVFAVHTRDARLKAVHSRSSYLPTTLASEPTVQQLYGDCEPGFHP